MPTLFSSSATRMAFADTAGSWKLLSELASKVANDRGFNFQEVGRRGDSSQKNGPPSSQALVRTFGTDESKIRVKLYRDNHGWCPYCHKVWLQLEEKQIPYIVEKINMMCYGDKKSSYLKKTPRGLLPAIEIDGRFMVESSVIMQTIEDKFPEYKPLMPSGSHERGEAEDLLQLERYLFNAWLGWLRMEDSPKARGQFEQVMDFIEMSLQKSSGPYFLGKDVSLVDCVMASTLERVAASIYYYKGLRVKGGRWPSVNRWFLEMETRDAYKAAQSDFHTHVHDLPPQIGGCISSGTPEQRAAAAAIDGTDGKSWNLPLPPLKGSYEEVQESPDHDRVEAALAVIHCHDGIVRSACLGTKAEQVSADAALRLVARALLEGHNSDSASVLKSTDSSADSSSGAAALRWTRDRISVPRDMSFPAARQLRAHLNWVADRLDPVKDGAWKGVAIPTQSRRDMDPKNFYGVSAA